MININQIFQICICIIIMGILLSVFVMLLFKINNLRKVKIYKKSVDGVIEFLVDEDKLNNIKFGYRKDKKEVFIFLKNSEVAGFINDWYSIMEQYDKKKLTKDTYDMLLSTLVENINNKKTQ